ncbi:MAG TPA: FkbM family methyltransferase [Blastocatellia bacterium]|jgi:FkbM family methyltransferase|nr:FkbM family methyltransferase [Spartobacteria bacterium]HAF14746.1 FkbM family methyltransferase [Blastocatellia bacterium]HCX28183.1 FkbM family methyltransferase [Blastocatellia bacterium]
MSALTSLGRRIGNELYRVAFPIYRPLYSTFKRYADRAERHLIASHLCEGSVVVDAGANIGIYSQFFSKCVEPGGAVHSFEPSPENFAHLREALSDFPYVHLNQLAVSDKTGESLLYVSDELNVDHRAYPPADGSRDTIVIRAVALDDYFAPGERVDLIKMDIQGYELHALRGSERVIRENRRIKLLLELWPYGLRQAGVDWKDVVQMLERHGMSIQQFGRSGLEPLRPESIHETAEWYVNLLAYRPTSG